MVYFGGSFQGFDAADILLRIDNFPGEFLEPFHTMEDPPKMYCRVDVDEATGLRTTAWIALSRDRESMTITIFDGWKLCVNIPLDDWNNRVCTSEDVRRAAMTCIGKQLLGEETISVTVARPLVEEEPIVKEEFVEQIVEQERPSAPEPITPITPNPEPVTSTSPVQVSQPKGYKPLRLGQRVWDRVKRVTFRSLRGCRSAFSTLPL